MSKTHVLDAEAVLYEQAAIDLIKIIIRYDRRLRKSRHSQINAGNDSPPLLRQLIPAMMEHAENMAQYFRARRMIDLEEDIEAVHFLLNTKLELWKEDQTQSRLDLMFGVVE